jgi:hypothetical protein
LIKLKGKGDYMKKYNLINNDGCLMKSIYASSIKKAREIFNFEFSGKYTIICDGNDWEKKNVILK